MSEITEDGYQSIRDFAVSAQTVPNQWDYIAIYDSNQSQVIRVSITGDSRFAWTDLDGDNIVQVEGTIEGSDSDIPTDGTTVEYIALWDSASGGRMITQLEQIGKLSFTESSDTLNITHNIEIPQRV